MHHLLTKSDFKVAQTCPTKLYYKKKRYPSLSDENELLKMLARGGFIVEEIARQLHRGGTEIDYLQGHAKAAEETGIALQSDTATLYEATFISGGKLVRADILEKEGNRIRMYEVKAKNFDTKDNYQRLVDDKPNIFRYKNNAEKIITGWRKYLEDITFQVHVVRELHPEFEITPYLILLNKCKATDVEVVYQNFEVEEIVNPETSRSSFEVHFTGDVESLRKDNLIVELNVSEEVELLMPEVVEASTKYLASLQPELVKIPPELTTKCAKCEYRVEDEQSGFEECWSSLNPAKSDAPHVFDLYQYSRCKAVTSLIESGRSRVSDLVEDDVDDGSAFAPRRLVQLKHTRLDTEWRSPELEQVIESFEYPLHFIDFETGMPAIPYYAGMHSYEPFPFQWSCHKIESPGANPVHSEWLNTEDAYPGFEFARSLQQEIGREGTVFRWAEHERTMLKNVLEMMKRRKQQDPVLELWLEDMVDEDRADGQPMVDMNKLCIEHYFHPLMRGKTSIKKVCDAVWQSSPEVRSKFPEYEIKGDVISPYQSLPTMVIDGEDVRIAEGVGAMIAYGKMLYGSKNEEDRETWRELLLKYCKLDTAAMVMIWYHWGGR